MAKANDEAALLVAQRGLPEGVHVRRVHRPFDAGGLDSVLGGRESAVWREGDDLMFCWRGVADTVSAWFGVEMSMERLEGTDLWALAVRIREIDRAAVSYGFLPVYGGESASWREPVGTWRGPAAPPPPQRADPLRGELRAVEFNSLALGERRTLQVYLPPGTTVKVALR